VPGSKGTQLLPKRSPAHKASSDPAVYSRRGGEYPSSQPGTKGGITPAAPSLTACCKSSDKKEISLAGFLERERPQARRFGHPPASSHLWEAGAGLQMLAVLPTSPGPAGLAGSAHLPVLSMDRVFSSPGAKFWFTDTN